MVDHAAPARLREAYLRLRAHDPATDVIADVRRLAELPSGSTAILALSPSVDDDSLDWLNLTRPVLSELRLSVVLWCEDDAAVALLRRAPDFFDWISARVDCPPAPAAHAVADIKRAICARARGIAWEGAGLEETLAAVRPGRPIRRVAVASYQSMIDALTSRDPGWLFLEGIDTEFHLRRLRWAMAETRRRVIVLRRAFERTAPGWWTVHAKYVPIADAVHAFVAAGGTGRLAALTGLDPDAEAYARFALRHGVESARLEELLAAAADPRSALQSLARQSGWTAAEVLAGDDSQRLTPASRLAIEREAARNAYDDDEVVYAIHVWRRDPTRWRELALAAEHAGDFEVAARWLSATPRSIPNARSPYAVLPFVIEGRSLLQVGDIASARVALEEAHSLAQRQGDASMIVDSAAELGSVLLKLGEPDRARECLKSALHASATLGDKVEVVSLLSTLARVLMALGDGDGARQYQEQARSIAERCPLPEEDVFASSRLLTLGEALAFGGDVEGARPFFERALELDEQLWGPDHPNAAAPLRRLGRVQRDLGDLRGARAHLERALKLQRVSVGSDEHPRIADTLVELARTNAAAGDLDGARTMLERALATQQRAYGDDGKLAGAATRRALAGVFVARGDLTRAISHLDRALATLRKIFERDDHPDIAATLRELSRLQQMQRELERPR